MAASQGKDEKDGYHIFATPRATLDRAKLSGYRGVCRDFAILLYWSLYKVGKSPTLTNGLKAMGGLDENSFSVQKISDDDANHNYVEVLLPVGQGDGQKFERIHLDSTFYPDAYSPLLPRHSGVSAQALGALRDECEKVRDCLFNLSMAKLPCHSPEARQPECK